MNQERLKGLLLDLASTSPVPAVPGSDWERTFERLMGARFEAEEVIVTETVEARALSRLHDALLDRKARFADPRPNGKAPSGLRALLNALLHPGRLRARRKAWIGLTVGVAAVLGFMVWQARTRPVEVGSIVSVVGTPNVSSISETSAETVQPNMTVRLGTRIETGTGERVKIRFNDGTTLALYPGTAIALPIQGDSASGNTVDRPRVVRLRKGRVWADVRNSPGLSTFSIETKIATAEALGTEFGVEVRDLPGGQIREAVLMVMSGEVLFFNRHGSVEATARTFSSARADRAPSLPKPRKNYASTSVDGTLYAIGGASHGTSSSVAAVEAYDPATDTWTSLAPLPFASQQLAAASSKGIIYAVGGCTAEEPLAELQAYDPTTNTWELRSPMPTARTGLSATVVGNKLYVLSGSHGFKPITYFDLVEAYDPATDTWETTAPVPTGRTGMGVGAIDGKLYTVGGSVRSGKGSNGWKLVGTVEVYDPRTNAWTSRKPMPTPRGWPAIGVIDGMLYAVGGYDDRGWMNKAEAYDPKTDTWRAMPPMPVVFESHYVGGAVHNGVFYVAGRVPDLEIGRGDRIKGYPIFQGNIGVASMTSQGWNYSDGDGLTDAEEEQIHGTDPETPDTDGDGLGDGMETWLGTDPTKSDSDGDSVMDWEDPTPLVRGAAGSRIVDALRYHADRVRSLPLSHFLIDSVSEAAARRRRSMLADGLGRAANMVAGGNRNQAMEWLWLQVRQDDQGTQAMDWMANGEQKAAIATELQVLSVLLRLP